MSAPLYGKHGHLEVEGPIASNTGPPIVQIRNAGGERLILNADDFANMVIYTGLSIAGRIRGSQNKPRRG